MDVYLNDLKKEINREIQVNDNISLQKFCEYVIISMNGNCKHLYQLIKNDEHAYLGPNCNIRDYDYEQMIDDMTLEDLYLEIGDELMLNYDFRCDWEFIIKIKNVTNGYFENEFEVTDGYGRGILEDCGGVFFLEKLLSPRLSKIKKEFYSSCVKGFDAYIEKNFSIIAVNSEIKEYFEKYRELVKPKNYIMNISLEGFGKEIKRKIAVDSNVDLDKFCKCIVLSMKGDLSHSYGIKIAKEYVDDNRMIEQDLNYLELKEKQKLKVIYDYGDNWIFNITVSKIIDNYGNKRFEVLSGKGYGIIDDCGGIWELSNIFDKKNKEWGNYNIDDFNLEKTNEIIDRNF